MMLAQVERKIADAQARRMTMVDVKFLLATMLGDKTGKMVGIKIPPTWRTRLEAFQKRHGLASIRQATLAAIIVGLTYDERASAEP